jgi:hypothetical protein
MAPKNIAAKAKALAKADAKAQAKANATAKADTAIVNGDNKRPGTRKRKGDPASKPSGASELELQIVPIPAKAEDADQGGKRVARETQRDSHIIDEIKAVVAPVLDRTPAEIDDGEFQDFVTSLDAMVVAHTANEKAAPDVAVEEAQSVLVLVATHPEIKHEASASTTPATPERTRQPDDDMLVAATVDDVDMDDFAHLADIMFLGFQSMQTGRVHYRPRSHKIR